MKPILYLLSEIHNRDWDARLLMADYATSRGFTTLVGEQWTPTDNRKILPPGLMLVKTLNQVQTRIMRKLKELGHIVAAMDEECLAIACDQDFLGFVSPEVGENCDVFYANSPGHAEKLAQQIPALKDKIVTLGNPRMDLLTPQGQARFQAEAEAIRRQCGPFILFNSNVAQSNSVWENANDYREAAIRTGSLDPNDPKSVDIFTARFEFEKVNSTAFHATIEWCLDNLPRHKVVIRPHPAARRSYWEEFATKSANIQIAFDTHHVPWIMAADVVVHTNSTTGLEAAIMRKPTVNLVPDPSQHWSKIYVMSRVNPTFTDWRDATSAIAKYAATGAGPLVELSACEAELERYFPGVRQGIISKNIVDHMIGLVEQRGIDPGPFSFAKSLSVYQAPGRSDVQKSKFSKSREAAASDFAMTRQASRLTHKVRMLELTESSFIIEPAEPARA